MRDVILTCAITGNLTRPEQTPHLPITPKQIANSALEAAEAGASIVHVHVRNDDGSPSMALAHYREVVQRIRSENNDVLLNLTTGPGQRYRPDPEDPRIAAPGSTLLPPLERVEHIQDLKPEICTLDLHTMNAGHEVVMNTPTTARVMAESILEVGTKPEFEIFNAGDLVLANELIPSLPFLQPYMFSFVLGVKYGWPASVDVMRLGIGLLPEGALWTGFGIGRTAFPMLAQSVLLGGHARIGFEDTTYLEQGVQATSNAELCAKACRIIKDLGCKVASPQSARAQLGL